MIHKFCDNSLVRVEDIGYLSEVTKRITSYGDHYEFYFIITNQVCTKAFEHNNLLDRTDIDKFIENYNNLVLKIKKNEKTS